MSGELEVERGQQRVSFWRKLASRHPIRRGTLLILLALVVEYLVLPQIAGVRDSLHLLGRANIALVILAVLLEVASLASYARLTKTVLPPRSSSFSRLWRIDMSTLALSHVLPGGTASGDGLGYRLLTNEGVRGSEAGVALAIQGIGSALVLNAILWLALIVSVPVTGFNPIYATAAIVGALLLAAFAGLVLLLTRGEERAAVALRGLVARVPFVKRGAAGSADRVVHQIAARIRVMGADSALLRRAVLWAAANWLLDAASLLVFLAAFGHVENPDGLLVAYGLAYVLAAVPVTPGGLGIVEGVLVPTLVGFGASSGTAIVAVISYRLVNFWLPIPVGAVSYLSLRAGGDQRETNRRDELRRAVAEARAQAALVRRSGGAGPPGAPGGRGPAGAG
ncbi:MAG: lysylphosphatidylglycerol synthase transmembrane domain-containing protein [Acidimicrobiales bacterium]